MFKIGQLVEFPEDTLLDCRDQGTGEKVKIKKGTLGKVEELGVKNLVLYVVSERSSMVVASTLVIPLEPSLIEQLIDKLENSAVEVKGIGPMLPLSQVKAIVTQYVGDHL